ncbi:MAG: hypothetical protein CMM15_09210 [Rhodospirillaceae bacterium]|nr:hypothetical protein [Rhodospirillaceae bacterium]OUU22762.1 MAG: hypothetical protein CBB97_14525 [Candidatus Endolissoclinum sp. TMED37]
MRVRFKRCSGCEKPFSALYRCKYRNVPNWLFLCESCLVEAKDNNPTSYQYGGRWKSRKK